MHDRVVNNPMNAQNNPMNAQNLKGSYKKKQ